MGRPRGIAEMVYEPILWNYFLAVFAKFRDSYIVGEKRPLRNTGSGPQRKNGFGFISTFLN